MTDWSKCPDVERKPGVLSGADVIVGTRVPPEAIFDNFNDGYSVEQIVRELFPTVPLKRAERVIAYARQRPKTSAAS